MSWYVILTVVIIMLSCTCFWFFVGTYVGMRFYEHLCRELDNCNYFGEDNVDSKK